MSTHALSFLPEHKDHPLSRLLGSLDTRLRPEGALLLFSRLPQPFASRDAIFVVREAGFPPDLQAPAVRSCLVNFAERGFLDKIKGLSSILWRMTPKGQDALSRVLAAAEVAVPGELAKRLAATKKGEGE